MVGKPPEPVWSIFSFTKEGARLQEYDIFPKLDMPQSLVIETDKKPPVQLERNKGIILNPSGRGDASQVKSKEGKASSGCREKVQLSEGEKTSFEILPEEFRPSTSTSTCEEPGEAVGAALKYFERKRLECLEFGRKSNFPVLEYQRTLKSYYKEFFNNAEKGIIGHVPGFEVGLTFRYRDELRLLGIHREKQKGIDSKDVPCKDGWNYERVALSVVLSGVYEDCEDHGEVLIYAGEGGRDPKTNQQVKDQTKKRLGNQALKNNYHSKTSVRVIRKRMDASSPSKRLFSYDGLYKVADWEYITGVSGFKVYRFRLVREPNQNSLVWQKREPKPFGHATCQDVTTQGATKLFVGQVGRAARAARRKGMKNSAVGQVECQGATSGRSVGGAAFIDISDEDSVSSESGESSENSFRELSDDESVSLDSTGGSMDFSGDMPSEEEEISVRLSEEKEEKPVSIPKEEDDLIILDGEEGGDCIVHEELDQGQVSPGCVEVGEDLPLDIKNVIATICDEGTEKEKAMSESMEEEAVPDGEYEVEKIVDKQGKSRQTKYLVRWKGYDESHDSWLPLSNLSNCRELVKNFNSSKKRRRIS